MNLLSYVIVLLLGYFSSLTSANANSESSCTANPHLLLKIKEKGSLPVKSPFIQNQLGQCVPSLTTTETVGIGGPITLKDTNFIEHIARLDRERIPERLVHARGMGAFGTFKVTQDITHFSKACVFEPNTETKIFARFSVATARSGTPDTIHDARGFALKFYTKCGNWDLLGNNMETFPIRDPMLFPSLIHSRSKNPRNNIGDPNSWWDFTSLRPETTFHTLQVFSYLGFPDGLRFMDGAAVNAFKLINAQGMAVYCKFHFLSKNGYRNLTQAEMIEIGGKQPDYSSKDLFDAIERKEYPSWELNIQVMTFEQAANSPFNPFDATKIWPRNQYPLFPVGAFTLDRNPDDYFKDVEMAAFNPGNLIPGIEMSPDRILQARSFSYSDTQRYRLGTNFLELPINRPVNYDHLHTYQRDGQGLVSGNGMGVPNYYPNSFYPDCIDPKASDPVQSMVGDVLRVDTGEEDNFSQATEWLKGRTEAEKKVITSNIANALRPVEKEIQDRALENFRKVCPKLKSDIMNELIKEK